MSDRKHWVRPLRGGGTEFYFAVPGNTMQGNAASAGTYDFLRDTFEQHTGTVLPEPEVKPMRGGSRKLSCSPADPCHTTCWGDFDACCKAAT